MLKRKKDRSKLIPYQVFRSDKKPVLAKPTLPQEKAKVEILPLQKAEVKTVVKKVALNTNLKLKSKTSLSGIIHSKNEKKEELSSFNPEAMPKASFTPLDLEEKWQRFCYQIQQDRRDSLYATLTKRKPTLQDNHTIILIIDNKVQEDYINEVKPDMMDFLRKELNNYSIVFNLIVEELNEDKMLYTGREKFEKMAESNPALKMLQNKLKLMID